MSLHYASALSCQFESISLLSVIELSNLRSRTLSRSRRREPSPPVDYPSDDTADTEPDVRMAEVGTRYRYLPSIY